jgi:class 3 adenylate cyclase
VLFADVKGSMELAEQVDAEEWHSILDRFFQILADGVHRFEGTVNQYTGDGIMALFGAPIAHEDHGQRACYAALHLRDKLRRYADDLRRTKGLSFSVRMGINSGEVIVGKIGDDLRMDYTAQGQVVNLARRMEQSAAPDTACLSERTVKLVEGFFRLRDLGEFDIKGMTVPVRGFELEGMGKVRTRLDLSRSRGFSQFVGRVDEMGTLELALNRALQGDGQVVGVVGQAGVGKSRLCLEFVERCRAKDIRVLEAHCPAHGKTVPLLPILELLRNSFGITAQEHDLAAREKIAGRLLLLGLASNELLSLVFDFLGVPDPDRPLPQMDPEGRQRQLYSFVRRLVQARSEREPAVLLFDDTQWIDSASDGFLTQLVEATSGTRTLLLTNFRPEYNAEWMGRSDYQQLPLAPLGAEAINELLDDLLGHHPTTIALRGLIRERTGGNPFFIEEVVQSLHESGSLVGTRGAHRLATPVEQLAIPATVQAVLAARTDRLPEREKRVLQTAAVAAVMKKRFSESLLRRVVGLPPTDLAATLSRLHGDEFICEETLYPELEYAFRHPLIQEVVYSTQLSSRRAELHAALARALEEIHSDKLDEHAALLAHHWEEAGEVLEAGRCHQRAALLIGRNDITEARRHWRRLRELARELPESREMVQLGAAACSALLNLSVWLGGDEDWEALFQEGLGFAQQTGDRRILAELHYGFAGSALAVVDIEAYLERSREAMLLAEQTDDAVLAARARLRVMIALGHAGRIEESLALAEELIDTPMLDATHRWPLGSQPTLAGLWWRGYIRLYRGELDRGEEDIREALALARAEGDSGAEILCWSYLVIAGDLRSDSDHVLDYARAGVEASERSMGSAYTHLWPRIMLGLAHVLRGEWEEACMVLEESLEHVRAERGAGLNEPVGLHCLARALHGAAKSEHAVAIARQALEAPGGVLDPIIPACCTLARLLRETQGAAARLEIERALDRAAQLIEQGGLKTLSAVEREERARLAGLLGDQAAWRGGLEEAARIFEESGARKRAEALRGELAS